MFTGAWGGWASTDGRTDGLNDREAGDGAERSAPRTATV